MDRFGIQFAILRRMPRDIGVFQYAEYLRDRDPARRRRRRTANAR